MSDLVKFRTIHIVIPGEEKEITVGKNNKSKKIKKKDVSLIGTLATKILAQDDDNINFELSVCMCSKKDNFNRKHGQHVAESRLIKGNKVFVATVKRPNDDVGSAFAQMKDTIASHLTDVVFTDKGEDRSPSYMITGENIK